VAARSIGEVRRDMGDEIMGTTVGVRLIRVDTRTF
jgi:hypothetical protein